MKVAYNKRLRLLLTLCSGTVAALMGLIQAVFFKSKRPLAKLYLVYYNLWAVAGTDTRLYPRSRPALPDPV